MKTSRRTAAISHSKLGARLMKALFFAVLTALCSKIYFHLWFTPVPVTLQVMGVILSGLVLGSKWGAICQLQYLAMGTLGLPVFAGINAGPLAFGGPSGGYLVGFVAGAFICGWVFEKLDSRTWLASIIAGVAGLTCIYAFGASWLGIWLGLSGFLPWNQCIQGAFSKGVSAFIGVDLLKVMGASGIALGGRRWQGLSKMFRDYR